MNCQEVSTAEALGNPWESDSVRLGAQRHHFQHDHHSMRSRTTVAGAQGWHVESCAVTLQTADLLTLQTAAEKL